MNKFFGVLVIVVAIAIAIVPQFNNCDYAGKSLALANGNAVPMKCLWTARAELGTGIALLAVGAMMTASRRKESLRNLSVMGVILGIFVMLFPTKLIGVCSSMMPCNTVMEPSMLALGTLAIVGSLAGMVIAVRRKE